MNANEEIVTGKKATYRIWTEVVQPKQPGELDTNLTIAYIAVNVETGDEVYREENEFPEEHRQIERTVEVFYGQGCERFLPRTMLILQATSAVLGSSFVGESDSLHTPPRQINSVRSLVPRITELVQNKMEVDLWRVVVHSIKNRTSL